MTRRTVDNVTYYPRTEKSKYKDQVQFYPIVEFVGPVVSDNFYLNIPQPTRSKARTIAINHIKNI